MNTLRISIWTSLLSLTALAACGDSIDSWFIVSEPSKGGLTIGVIKDGENTTMNLVQSPGGSQAFLVREHLEGETREQYYAVANDLVLEKKGDAIRIESPAFATGSRSFPSTTGLTLGKDGATLLTMGVDRGPDGGRETWWISGWGNLLIQQNDEGLTIHREGKPPQSLDRGATLRARGKSYEIADPHGKLLLLQPGKAPEPEQRMAYVEERKAVQFFDAAGKVIAELPASGIEIAPGGQPFFLTGQFPQGLTGVSDRPFSVLMPLHNRHLILLTH